MAWEVWNVRHFMGQTHPFHRPSTSFERWFKLQWASSSANPVQFWDKATTDYLTGRDVHMFCKEGTDTHCCFQIKAQTIKLSWQHCNTLQYVAIAMGPWYSICIKSKCKLNATGFFLSTGLLIYLLGPTKIEPQMAQESGRVAVGFGAGDAHLAILTGGFLGADLTIWR